MGLDTLIDAAARVACRRPFRILIGGSGPDAARLSQAIESKGLSDRVYLLGRIPEEQLPLCYAAADAFVLPTRSLECFGLIVLEAFACGTPVIGARVGAIPELLTQVGDEWMFPPSDPDALADRLDSFLDRKLTSKCDLREVASRYDIRRQMPRWIDLCVGSQGA
jgi:glycosyltransferase involved in cell wall biosynthesis